MMEAQNTHLNPDFSVFMEVIVNAYWFKIFYISNLLPCILHLGGESKNKKIEKIR